ncbi:MAG: VOC family protein [Chitinophagaceae bacterium]
MQKLTTFLMFEGKAEAAMNFYISLFKDSAIISIKRNDKGDMGAENSVQHATFTLAGQQFMCIDSPPVHGFTFTPAMSIYVSCKSEQEIKILFEKLSAGGSVLMPLGTYPFSDRYAWVTDQFGVAWQLNFGTLNQV